MTSTMVEGWGARALEEREAERRRRRWDLIGGFGSVAFGVALVDAMTRGFAPRTGERPVWVTVTIAAAFVVFIGVALWRAWRDEDELQWRISVNSLAAIGAASLLLNFAADNLHALIHYDTLRHHIFLATLAVGLLAYGWQKVRS